MKHIKLFEEFLNEARMSAAQSWLTDYFNAVMTNAESNYFVDLEKLQIDMFTSIKNPIDNKYIDEYVEHSKWNSKRHIGIAKKADKKKNELLKELPEILKSNPGVEKAIPIAERAAKLKGKYDIQFIRSKYEEYAKDNLTTDTTDLKNILKVTDAYHKEFEAGKKELEKAQKEYENTLNTL